MKLSGFIYWIDLFLNCSKSLIYWNSHLESSNKYILLTQVNIPKTRKTFCKAKKCKKHTLHKVTQYKAGKASLYAQGIGQFYICLSVSNKILMSIIDCFNYLLRHTIESLVSVLVLCQLHQLASHLIKILIIFIK